RLRRRAARLAGLARGCPRSARCRACARRIGRGRTARRGRRVTPPLERAREAMRAAGFDAVLAASPGLVAFLTGHVLPAHLAYPSRDGRLEKPTLALVTQGAALTVGVDPKPSVGEAVSYGSGRSGLADARFAA